MGCYPVGTGLALPSKPQASNLMSSSLARVMLGSSSKTLLGLGLRLQEMQQQLTPRSIPPIP